MTENPVRLTSDDELLKVREIFDKKRIHHIPVVDGERLVGIVSQSDYLFFCRSFSEQSSDLKMERFRLKSHSVNEVMTKGLPTLGPNQNIKEALQILRENYFHAIPIVENKKLVGIVTTWDIIDYITDNNVTTKENQTS